MTYKELVSIRDTIKKVLEEHKDEISNNTKVHCDSTVNYLSNLILDVEKEMKFAKRPYITYNLKIEF